jgi:hypothetical protein
VLDNGLGRRTNRFGPNFDPDSLASADEVRKAIEELELERLRIKRDIEAAKAHFHETGERADPIWLSRAKAAIRGKSNIRQRLQDRLGVLRRAEKESRIGEEQRRFERCFIDAARVLLTPSQFIAVAQAAQARSATSPDQSQVA